MCRVEVVDASKEVLVLTKSQPEKMEKCLLIFNDIIKCIMKAKVEFCHAIRPRFFLINSASESDYHNKDKLFGMTDVREAMMSSKDDHGVLSVSGNSTMDCSKLLASLQKHTLWSTLFQLDEESVLSYLKEVVELHSLATQLSLPSAVFVALERDFPTDTDRRRLEFVKKWLSSSPAPCWWHLVQALRRMDFRVLAEKIENEHGKLQACLGHSL